jgi:hypothetical protein
MTVTVAALALATAVPAHGNVMLMPSAQVEVGSCGRCDHSVAAHQLASGDFNGDGKADLATLGGSDPTMVQLMIGDGAGHVSDAVAYPAVPAMAIGPTSLAVGDFNEDQRDDLITTGPGGTTLLEGTASPGFEAPITIGSAGALAAVGDFNGDDHTDVATYIDGVSSAVRVLLGNGDGTFGSEAAYASISSVADLLAGDFNSDGKDDLAVVSGADGVAGWYNGWPETWPVAFLKGAANGVLTSGGTLNAPGLPRAGAVGDLNGDGKADIVLSDMPPFLAGGASALFGALGAGDLTFGAFTRSVNSEVFGDSLAVADFDNDGMDDVAVGYVYSTCSAPNRPTLAVALGDGTGTFSADDFTICATGGVVAIAAPDMNGDGWPDVAEMAAGHVRTALSVPSPAADRAAVDFGSADVGARTGAQQLTITNDGAPPLHLSNVTIAGSPDEFPKLTDNCSGATLEEDAACTITLAFAPTAAGGRSATLTVTGDGYPSSASVALNGSGTTPSAPSPPSSAPVPSAPTVARLWLTAGRQTVLRKRALIVRVGSDVAVQATVSATLKVRGRRLVVLRPIALKLEPEKTIQVKLIVAKRVVSKIRAALKRHAPVTAQVKLASPAQGTASVVKTLKITR